MLVKCRIKEYPDGTKQAYVYNDAYFKDNTGYDQTTSGISICEKDLESIEKDRLHSEHMSLVRTRNQVKDYVLSNEFDMFWTLTFNNKRESDKVCFDRMSNWLKYMKKKYGLFDYIFIPERHEDGCIHFHGVTGAFKGVMVDSGVKLKGQIIYNCNEWNYGFSTVSIIRDKKRAASYITKYITKELSQDVVGKGKKKYWSSRGLRKPVETYFEYVPFENKEPDWENKNIQIFNL